MLFTRLITYDARYHQSTDATAFFEAYGDIVGGIGSYPVLGNPHYHTATDLLETMNHQLITETSKTTVATLFVLPAVFALFMGWGRARSASLDPFDPASRHYVADAETASR